jgi:hypothetical protein
VCVWFECVVTTAAPRCPVLKVLRAVPRGEGRASIYTGGGGAESAVWVWYRGEGRVLGRFRTLRLGGECCEERARVGKPDYVCVCAGGGEMVRARLATASSLGWEGECVWMRAVF